MNANAPAVYVWDVQTSEFLLLLLITMLNIAALNGTAHPTSLQTGTRKKVSTKHFLSKAEKPIKALNELKTLQLFFFSFDGQNKQTKEKTHPILITITTVASTLISSVASHLAPDASYLSSSGVFQRLLAAACLHVLRC